MSCLYCGKEIGTFRLLRGEEFCSPAHRKLYGERLGKVLGRMNDLEPRPVGTAGFTLQMPLQIGNRQIACRAAGFVPNCHSIEVGSSTGVTLTPLLGGAPKPMGYSEVRPPDRARPASSPAPLAIPVRFSFSLPERLAVWQGLEGALLAPTPAAPGDTALGRVPPSLRLSPAVHLPALTVDDTRPWAPSLGRLCGDPNRQSWMPSPAAMPVERSRYPFAAGPLAAEPRPRLPQFTHLAAGRPSAPPSVRFQRSSAPALATPPAKPRLGLSPVPLDRESVRLCYPDVEQLEPAEDLVKDVRVAAPAGFAETRPPRPAQVRPSRAALDPLPDFSAPAAVSLPMGLRAIVVGATGLPSAPLVPASLPGLVEPLPATAPDSSGPTACEAPPLTFAMAGADRELAPGRALAPFANSPAPSPVECLAASAASDPRAIAWPPNRVRTGATALGLPSEAALASFIASPAPIPVECMPRIPAFRPAAISARPRDHRLELPNLVHRPLSALPMAAPATRVVPFPRLPRGKSRSATCAISAPSLRLPKYSPGGPAVDAETKPLVALPVSFQASPATPAPQPIVILPAASLPSFSSSDRPEIPAAGFDPSYPPAAGPVTQSRDTEFAVLRPISTLPANPAAIEAECTPSAVPAPSFIAIDFYLQRAAASLRFAARWCDPSIAVKTPRFILPLIEDQTDQMEDPVMTRPIPQTPSTVTEILSHPDARRLARRHWTEPLAKVAACMIVGLFLWFGTRALTVTGQRIMADRVTVEPAAPSEPAVAANARTAVPPSAPAAPQGFWARTEQAIARRATLQVGDNFRAGMESWGVTGKTWAPGWSRNPDGYVYAGGLELFRPSLNFADYRLEFFGQIESKGLGWAMRGRDKQNYYAMKLNVIQAGLRPVVAMVHYPVVEGKKGHTVETPLNIMVHHNEPFHVSVDVSGNRFTASVEGQRVESWTDDALPVGGVGFFTEASERARLYWMKVTKNDDWLGSLCSFLAGNRAREVAELWAPGIPQDAPLPAAPVRSPDAILAETANSLDDFGGRPMRGRPADKT